MDAKPSATSIVFNGELLDGQPRDNIHSGPPKPPSELHPRSRPRVENGVVVLSSPISFLGSRFRKAPPRRRRALASIPEIWPARPQLPVSFYLAATSLTMAAAKFGGAKTLLDIGLPLVSSLSCPWVGPP